MSLLISFTVKNKEIWEYELVKISGTLTDEKFFVLRTKDGRFGYLMIQGFLPDSGKPKMWVNKGWVPINKKQEFQAAETPKDQLQITGLLKKAEHLEVRKKDRDLFDQSSDYHIIDLEKFSKTINCDSCYQNFFIEQVINEAEESDFLYPCPSTRYNYNRPYLTPQKHLEYSTFWGFCTSIGLISLIKVARMK